MDKLEKEWGKTAFVPKEEFAIYVIGASMDVTQTDWEHGEVGRSVQVQHMGVKGPFTNMKQAVDVLAREFGAPMDKEAWAIFDEDDGKGRLDAQWTVDEDNAEATPRDIEAWKKGDKPLWAAYLTASIMFAKQYQPSAEELAKLTGFQRT